MPNLAEKIRALPRKEITKTPGATALGYSCGHADAIDSAAALAAKYEASVSRLVKLVESLRNLVYCDALHHGPSERHGVGEPCPAVARWNERIAAVLKDHA